MRINRTDASRFQAAYLRKDFDDSIDGNLDGQSIQVREDGQARAADRGPFRQIRSLLGRIRNALTPTGARAEREYRRGVQEFSAALDRLIGDLRVQNGTVDDAQQVARRLADLLEKAGSVISHGTKLPDLVQARADLHIEKLGTDDLIALRKSLRTDAVMNAVEHLGTGKEKDGGA